jgi:hypothetical protein
MFSRSFSVGDVERSLLDATDSQHERQDQDCCQVYSDWLIPGLYGMFVKLDGSVCVPVYWHLRHVFIGDMREVDVP